MQKILLGLLILVLVATGVGLFVLFQPGAPVEEAHASPTRRAPAAPAPVGEQTLAAPGAPQDAPTAPAAEPADESPTHPVPVDTTRRSAQELARLHGRVTLPEGTPRDERLSVRVLAAEPPAPTGAPPDLTAEEPQDDALAEAEVDAGGSFELAVPLDRQEVWIALDARYLWLEEAPRIELAEDTPVALAPALGAWVEGRLIVPADATPEELDGVGDTVALRGDPMRSVGAMGLSRRGILTRFARAAADRGFEFRGVKPDVSYELRTRPDRLTAAKSKSLEPTAGAHLQVDLTLTRGASVSGRVLDPAGEPVAGAKLELTQDPLMFGQGGFEVRQTESADDGTFELVAVLPGKSSVKVSAQGYLETSSPLELAEGERLTGRDFVLDAGTEVSGRVLWPDGTAAAGVEVKLHFDFSYLGGIEAFNAMKGARGEAETDEQGRFTIGGLGKGPFTVEATAEKADDAPVGEGREDGEQPQWRGRADAVRPGAEVELRLAPPIGIDGVVVDDRGEPISAFKVTARTKTGGMMEGLGAQSESGEFADDEGRFHLDGLHEGDWLVLASADGFGFPEPVAVSVPQVAGATVKLVLERAAAVTGTVVDPAGDPVGGAVVGPKLSLGDLGRMGAEGREPQQAFCDEDGKFELAGLTPGALSLVASADGFARSEPLGIELEVAETLEDVVLQLRTGGRILGEVLDDDGDPLVGRTVLAQVPTDPGQQRFATSDIAGGFEFDNLAPGTYQVMTFPVRGEDGSPGEIDDGDFGSFFSEMKMTMAEVVDGEDTHVVLGSHAANPVTVHGRVVAGGKPVSGVLVSFFSDGGQRLEGLKFASTGSDGTFEFELPSPGRYLVNVQKISGTGQQQNVEFSREIPEAERFELELELPMCGISGTVYDPNRKPMKGARVSLSVDGAIRNGSFTGGNYAEIQTADDGSYELLWLRPGTYSVAAGGNSLLGMFGKVGEGPGRQVKSGLKLGADEFLHDVDFHLKQPGTLVGNVLDLGGKPVAGAAIFLRDGNGRPLDRFSLVETDAAGHFQYGSLEPGEYTVSARDAARVSTADVSARVREGQDTEVELAIDAGTVLLVSLSDKEGNPVQCSVEVLDSQGRQVNGLWSMSELMATFSKGGFSSLEQRVGPLPPGKYRVMATSHDGLSANKPVTLRSSMETRKLNLRLD